MAFNYFAQIPTAEQKQEFERVALLVRQKIEEKRKMNQNDVKAGELDARDGFIFDEEPPKESVDEDFPLNGPGAGNEPPNICEGCQ